MVHDLRKCPVVVGSPQTQTQRDQVTRVIRRLMTNTSFHRRTLSDIFSHAGAARLSVLMDEESQRSPRSDAASASACAPYCTSTSRDMDCRLASDGANSTGGEDDDDDDEEEGVIAMGLDCLDNDNDLNFVDVSEVADHQAAYYPHCFPAMSSAHLTRDNVDSYIDSDESASVSGRNAQRNVAAAMVVACQLHCRPPPPTHAADITSPAFADHHRRQNFQNLLEASDQCGAGMRDCLPHSGGSTGSSACHDEQGQPMAVTRPVEENRQLDALMEQREQEAYQQQQQQHIVCVSSSAGHEEQGQGQHRSSSSSSCNGSSSNQGRNLAYIGNGSACSESGSDKSSLGPSISAADCGYYDSAVAVATLDSREMCVEGEGTSFQATDTVELSSPSEHTSRPAPAPVPMPPPGSCRPSTTPCSSSSSGNGSGASPGVLAGLRNFRLQWGGSAGPGYSTTHSATGAGQPLVAKSDNKYSSASTPAPSSMTAGAAVTETDFSGVLPNSNHSD
jgi:hypothetical protein